ncbi:MAG: DUF1700 domain-containing protein [Clostridia bacterium]|nr:DUF1700 domain-containing protein [Clostridia bacterium]
MTLRQWEKQFKRALKGISKKEKQTALEYYRELYGDKVDAGCTPEEAVETFGSPTDCAQNILADSENTVNVPAAKFAANEPKTDNTFSVHSAASITGMVFLTIFIVIPLYAILISVIAAFAAATISSGAGIIAGVVYTLAYPIYLIVYGAPWSGVVANLGASLAVIGVCIFLLIAFYYATKYIVIGAIKLFKLIYFKGEKA